MGRLDSPDVKILISNAFCAAQEELAQDVRDAANRFYNTVSLILEHEIEKTKKEWTADSS